MLFSVPRYRGWLGVQTKKGEHFVLTSPTFENSYQGRLHKKLHLTTKSQAKKVTSDFAYRYTKSSEVRKRSQNPVERPNTAPAIMQNSALEDEEEDLEDKNLPHVESQNTVDTGYESCEDKSQPSSKASLAPSQAWSSEVDSVYSKSSVDSHLSPEAEYEGPVGSSKSTEDKDVISLKPPDNQSQGSYVKNIQDYGGKDNAKVLKVPKKEKISVDSAPVPQMQHSKPKVVAVGGIGKISLLESISELQQWEEDRGEEEEAAEDSYRPKSLPNPVLQEDPVLKIVDEGEEKTMEDNLHLLSRRLSAGGGGGGKNKKRSSTASIEMPALTIEEKIEREKQARIKKQKRLQGSNLQKMGITVFSPPQDRRTSLKSAPAGRTRSGSSSSASPHHPNKQTHSCQASGSPSKSSAKNDNNQTITSSQNTSGSPISEQEPRSHSGVKKLLDKSARKSSLQPHCKTSIRNNVTHTNDFEKENIQVIHQPSSNNSQKGRKEWTNLSKQNCDERRRVSVGCAKQKGKYDRLLKRMEGCISDVFVSKLSAPRPKVN